MRATRTAAELAEYVEHFRARVLQDALNEATAACWIRRAEAFEDARHRPAADYPGRATVVELRARWSELTEKAQACRNRAAVSLLQGDIEPIVTEALEESA